MVWVRDAASSSVAPAPPAISPGLLAKASPPAFAALPRCQTHSQGTELSASRA